MNLRQAIKMAYKSILSNKGRSFLTMLGIIIGIASVMTIVSVVNGMNAQQMKAFESMGTNKVQVNASFNNGNDVFQPLYDYCLQLDDYVLGVTPNAYLNATVTYGTKSSANMGNNGGGMMYMGGGGSVSMGGGDGGGTGLPTAQPPQMYFGSDQYAICNNFKIEKGRDISRLDITQYAQVCVLGARAAQNFFDFANPVGQQMEVGGVPYTVIGVYAAKDENNGEWSMDNIMVFPYTNARTLAPGQPMSEFVVKAKDGPSTTEAISRITGFLNGLIPENAGFKSVYSDNTWIKQSNEMANMMSLVLGGIAFISLLVGGIGIMNIMLVTVTERTREIGIRRAIGAQRKSIVTQFLIEAAMICGMGGIIGILFGTLTTMIAGKFLLKELLLPALWITGGAFALSVILGIVFGIYPAVKASGLQPVVALRAE